MKASSATTTSSPATSRAIGAFSSLVIIRLGEQSATRKRTPSGPNRVNSGTAIAVPLFTLFGPDGVRLRVADCSPNLMITNEEKAPIARDVAGLEVVVADEAFMRGLADYSQAFTPA